MRDARVCMAVLSGSLWVAYDCVQRDEWGTQLELSKPNAVVIRAPADEKAKGTPLAGERPWPLDAERMTPLSGADDAWAEAEPLEEHMAPDLLEELPLDTGEVPTDPPYDP